MAQASTQPDRNAPAKTKRVNLTIGLFGQKLARKPSAQGKPVLRAA